MGGENAQDCRLGRTGFLKSEKIMYGVPRLACGRDELPGLTNGCSAQKRCSKPLTSFVERLNRFNGTDLRRI